ncbi:MAG TPA: RND transporter, partial [Acidimicrobiia bacterium]|nr:RND transporter [Acidimicrobiia bacterium]
MAGWGAAVVVVVATGVGLSRLRIDTGVSSLVPASDRAVTDWEAAQRSFGGDPVLVLFETAERGALLSPGVLPRLLALEGELAGLPDVAVVYGPGTVANQIAAQIQDLLLTVTARRDAIRAAAEQQARTGGASEEKARAAGQAAVAAFEVRYGALVAAGLPVGLPTLKNPTFAPRIFLDDAGQARAEFRWIVPDASHAAIYVRPREGLDQEGTEALVGAVRARLRVAGLPAKATVTGAPVVAVALGAEIRRSMPRLAAGALLAVIAAFVFAPRARGLWRFTPLVAALAATAVTLGVFGLAGADFSLGLAAFLPIMVGVGSDFPIQSTHPTRGRTLWSAAAASAAGFAALALSPLPFVRSLGLALALGIVVSAALGMVAARRAPAPTIAPLPAGTVIRPDRRLLVVGGVVAAVGLALLPSVPLETRPDRLVAGLGAVDDAHRAERVLGASGEVAVWVRGSEVLTPTTLRWFRDAEAALVVAFGDRLRPVVSPGRILQFLGDAPTASQIDAALRVLPAYLSGTTVRSDRREAVMSFGLRLGDLSRQSALLRQVARTIPPAPPGLAVVVTGLPVVAARAHDLLSHGRVVSNLSGLGLVAAVLLAALRDRRQALAAALAAVLAFGWGLVLLRLTGVALSPLTVALGSLTAAVGAEF